MSRYTKSEIAKIATACIDKAWNSSEYPEERMLSIYKNSLSDLSESEKDTDTKLRLAMGACASVAIEQSVKAVLLLLKELEVL